MRIATFLSGALLLTVVLFARSYFAGVSTPIDRPIAQMPQTRPHVGTDGERMWTRAEIRVLPLDLVSERKAELDSLRSRVAQAKIEDLKLGRANPGQRERADLAEKLIVLHYGSSYDRTAAFSESHLFLLLGSFPCCDVGPLLFSPQRSDLNITDWHETASYACEDCKKMSSSPDYEGCPGIVTFRYHP